jgi:hypothetical protein
MPQFQTGAKPGPGRPKGSKDKRQFNLTYWFNLILENYGKLTPYQRAEIALTCWKTLINKAKALPVDPEDSAFNATEALESLREIEEKTKLNNVKKG